MVEKQKIIDNKRLLNFIIKNNLCFGDFHKNKGLEKYIWSFEDYRGTVLFNIYEQIKMLHKVRAVFSRVLFKRKRILFLGINHLNFSRGEFHNINLINREIFKLCFQYFDFKLKNFINILLDKIFNKIYSPYIKGRKFINVFNFLNDYKKYTMFLSDCLIKSRKVKSVGFFFPSWVQGYFSNYHFLRGQLGNNMNKIWYLDQIGVEGDKSSFFNRYRSLKLISKIFDFSDKGLPGVIVCFSRIGYNSFFSEFRKLGIPVICIISNGDSLEDIDYPLIGDSLDLGVFFFYQKILQNFINKKRTFVRKSKKCF